MKATLTAAAMLAIAAGSLAAQTSPAQASLKDEFKGAFLVGAALNPAQFEGRDARGEAIVRRQFNTITPENVLKWERVHPKPGVYDFKDPDAYVAFGQKNHMAVIGHTLVWHSQTPAWVFQGPDGKPASRDTLLARMRDHIRTVVGRYKGRIRGWDVVNEALNEDGSLRQSPWLRIIGPDFIVEAFRAAHAADPKAELYYNDYSLENAPKRAGAIRIVKELQAAGIPVAAVGTQGHFKMDWPTAAAEDSTIAELAATGAKVNVTELDIDVLPPANRYRGADVSARAAMADSLNPYKAGLPDSVQQALAKRYADLFAVYLKHKDVLDRITFWGVTDGDSWLNGWPVPGRTAYPLLFDRQGQPKPAFVEVVRTARASRTAGSGQR